MYFSFNNLKLFLLTLPKDVKKTIVIFCDVVLCVLSLWIAFYLRLGDKPAIDFTFLSIFLIATPASIGVLWALGFYEVIIRYADRNFSVKAIYSFILFGIFFFLVLSFIRFEGVPRTIAFIHVIVFLALVNMSRTFARQWLSRRDTERIEDRHRCLIYGAGRSGQLVKRILELGSRGNVIGFIDDNSSLVGRNINGVRVYSGEDLRALIVANDAKQLYLAIPSLKSSKKSKIFGEVNDLGIDIKTVPSVDELVSRDFNYRDLRDIDVSDLLSRKIVAPVPDLLESRIASKIVAVTGAGGSIGSEICFQVINGSPAKIVLIDNSEHGLYQVVERLKLSRLVQSNEELLIPVLVDVNDRAFLLDVLQKYGVDILFHSAAYKHVPIVEENPITGIINNVFGTLSVVESCISAGCSDFVLISSDKSVRPTSVMGCTKRICELIVQAKAVESNARCKLSAVRFGNVLGSSGSVVPKFRQQILSGGPITLTHPEMNRYFMTIPEAAQLVIQAAGLADGSGEIFVLDMGEPVYIADLAAEMIRLHQMQSHVTQRDTIDIVYTGLRKGEKLYEELFIGDDISSTGHEKIFKVQEGFVKWDTLQKQLSNLYGLCSNHNPSQAIEAVFDMVRHD